MKTKKVVTLLLCSLIAIGSTWADDGQSAWSAESIPNPTKSGTGYVTSIGGYLTDAEIATINELIVGIEKDTSVEIAVVVVPSLAEDIFTESQALFDAWKIGKEGKDNGLLIVASIEDRDFRTHTGYGMEGVFTDAALSLMQESIVIPEFREGRYGKGIIDYVTELGRVIRDPTALEELNARESLPVTERVDTRTIRERLSGLGDELVPFLVFSGIGFLIILGAAVSLVAETRAVLGNRRKKFATYASVVAVEGKGIGKNGFGAPAFLFPFGAVFFSVGLAIGDFFGLRQIATFGLLPPGIGLAFTLVATIWSGFVRKGIIRRWRRDPRECPECGGEMRRLSEKDDDAYLLPTQIREEEIKSEDYDVHVCSACGASTIEKFRGSRYALFTACPSCKAMASRQKRREVVRRPSYTMAGEAMLYFECEACSHTFTKTASIPKLTRSSGSSGSSGRSSGGGSSFGGGRSGGGGASSSW